MPVSITSRFRPMTYDEISRPLIEQTQAQQALEGAYMEASTQAAQIMAQADEQTDPIAYARLKSYSEALQQQADSLMQQGLNRNSRRALLEMRNRYNQYIMPVQNAVERRKELSEERRKLSLSHPDMIWERDTLNLDDLMQNPQLDYGRTVLGSQLTERVGQAVAAAARGLQTISMGQNLDKYTQTIIQQAGFTPEEIAEALRTDPSERNQNNILAAIRDGILQSTGVMDWNNEKARQKAIEYANEGFYQGIGNKDIKTQQDFEAAKNLEYQHSLGLMREKARLDEEAAQRKDKRDAENALFGNWKSGSRELLEANGEQGEYNTLLGKLIDEKTGKSKSSYFGTNMQANPLEVYENYTNLKKMLREDWQKEANKAIAQGKANDAMSIPGVKRETEAEARERYSEENFKKRLKEKWEAVKDINGFHGVTDVISKDDYERLKRLGYDSQSQNMYVQGDLASHINELSTQYTISSINIPHLEKHAINDDFKLSLKKLDEEGKELGTYIKHFDSTTGKEGEAAKYKNFKDKDIYDISYSQLYPDKLIITMSDSKEYVVDPKVLSTKQSAQLSGLVNKYVALMNKYNSIYDRSYQQEYAIKELYELLNAYNKRESETVTSKD